METTIKNMPSIRYSAYKNSGIEWVEDVPAHWEVKKFKRVFYEIKKRSNPNLNCGSISFGKVVYKDDEKIPESTKKSYQVVNKGDFLVNPLNLNYDLISLRIALSNIDVVVSSGYIVLSNSVQLDKTFYKYFLHRFDVAFMKVLGSGVRQTLNWNDIANCDLIFPPLREQTAIAAFLDRKTALIDQAIDIKQKQIELLQERRQILIHKAVTHGLNPDVKMKDSGVEWIGEIPEHWEVKNLRYAFEFLNNKRIPLSAIERENMVGNFPYYGASGIIDYIDQYIFDEKLILIGEDGANLLSKSTPLAFVANGKFWVNNHAHILRPLFEGFNYWAEQLSLIDYTVFISGAAQPKLSRGNLSAVKVIVPTLKDLDEISSYLETVSDKISTTISLKEQEIEKLKEYKATLINSAVTGKIKVYNDAE
ncbi:restriction endonuclease subunit S [Aquirufa sp. TARAVU-A1A]